MANLTITDSSIPTDKSKSAKSADDCQGALREIQTAEKAAINSPTIAKDQKDQKDQKDKIDKELVDSKALPFFGLIDQNISAPQDNKTPPPGKETETLNNKSGLPNLILSDQVTKAPSAQNKDKPQETLSKDAVEAKVESLHSAIHSGIIAGDGAAVLQTLGSLNQTDRSAVEQQYDKEFGDGKQGFLRQDAQKSLYSADSQAVQAALDSKDGQTNLAGNVQVALSLAKHDQLKGNELLRNTLKSLNTEQITDLQKSYKEKYGTDFNEALNNDSNISKSTKDALPILEKGSDKRDSTDLANLAKIGLKNYDQQLFKEALGGDSAAAKEARTNLQNDKEFMQKFNDATSTDGESSSIFNPEVSDDILKQGRVSLKTIASEDIGLGILSANKDNISLAVQNASETEKAQYTKGMNLASEQTDKSNSGNLSKDDQEALNFYNSLHSTLAKAGDASEVTAWEDQLSHGKKTIISDLAANQNDHWFTAKSHTTESLMSTAEHLSKDDWDMLHQHKDATDPVWKELKDSLKTYAKTDEQDRIVSLLQKKANADSFEDSQKIHRSLDEVVKDNKTNGDALSSGGDVAIAKAIGSMSLDEAKRYHEDANFKTDVDNLVSDKLNPTEAAYAKASLKQVEETGYPAKPNPELQILRDSIEGASQSDALHNIKTAMGDENFRQKLLDSKDPIDQQVKQIIKDQLEKTFAAPVIAGADGAYIPEDTGAKAFDGLMQTGKLPVTMELEQGLPITSETYKAIAEAQPDEQKQALSWLGHNPDELSIALNVIQQGGKMDLADQARAYAIGNEIDPNQLKDSLKQTNLADFTNQYAEKYHNDASHDLLQKASGGNQTDFSNLFKADSSDAIQDAFNHGRASDSGLVNDGTRLTLDRASQDFFNKVETANADHTTLSQEDLTRLNNYSDTAMQQYNQSKQALADAAADGAITVGSLAAVPFTGGVSLAGLSLAAGVGAAADVGIHAMIQGSDSITGQQVAKDALGGAFGMASNFAGGELAAKALNIGAKVAERTAEDVVVLGKNVAGSEAGLIDASKQLELQKDIQKMIQEKLGSGGKALDQSEIQSIAAKYATNSENTQEVNALTSLLNTSLNKEVGSVGVQAAQSAGLQSLGFGAGSALGATGDWDSNKSVTENLTNIAEASALGAVAGAGSAGIGAGIGKLSESFHANKALPSEFHGGLSGERETLEKQLAPSDNVTWKSLSEEQHSKFFDKIADISSKNPDLNLNDTMHEVNTVIGIASKANLNTTETEQLLDRFANFKADHPDIKLDESSDQSSMDLAKSIYRNAQDRSIASVKMATTDYSKAGIANKAGLTYMLDGLAKDGTLQNYDVAKINLNGFKEVNDQFDHQTGDLILQATSKYLKDSGVDGVKFVNLGGNDFAAIIPKNKQEDVQDLLAQAQMRVSRGEAVVEFPEKRTSTTSNVTAGSKEVAEETTRTKTIVANGDGVSYETRTTNAGDLQPATTKVLPVSAEIKDDIIPTVDKAGNPKTSQEIMNNVFGNNGGKIELTKELSGVSAEAQAAGDRARESAASARVSVMRTDSVSDSVLDISDKLNNEKSLGALSGDRSSPAALTPENMYRNESALVQNFSHDELSLLNNITTAESNAGKAAYQLDLGTGLVAKEEYEHQLALRSRNNDLSGVVIADVRGFGILNGLTNFNREALGAGRHIGDAGIEAVSDVLRDAVKTGAESAGLTQHVANELGNSIARPGGDELAIILPKDLTADQQRVILEHVNSIRVGITTNTDADGKAVASIRRLEPGEKLKPGEMDIGVAAGLATTERAESEQMLRAQLYKSLMEKDQAGAEALIQDAGKKYDLPDSRVDAIKKELAASIQENKFDGLIQPLDKILQTHGDAASEHIKVLQKEFRTLSEDEIGVTKTLIGQLKQGDSETAYATLANANISDGARQSIDQVLADVKGGALTPKDASSVLADRVSFSVEHPEYAGQDIKINRMGIFGYPQEFQALEHQGTTFDKVVGIDNRTAQTKTLDANEFKNAQGEVVAVLSKDGKTVFGKMSGPLENPDVMQCKIDSDGQVKFEVSNGGKVEAGGKLFELQQEAIAAQKLGAERAAEGNTEEAEKFLTAAKQKLQAADQLTHHAVESSKYDIDPKSGFTISEKVGESGKVEKSFSDSEGNRLHERGQPLEQSQDAVRQSIDSPDLQKQFDRFVETQNSLINAKPERFSLDSPIFGTTMDETIPQFNKMFDTPEWQNGTAEERLKLTEKLSNQIASNFGLPPVEMGFLARDTEFLKVNHAGGLYIFGQGTTKIWPASFEHGSEDRLVQTLTHELTHQEQDFIQIRRLADQLGVGATATEDQKKQIIASYNHIQKELDTTYLDKILSVRDGHFLSEKESARADGLYQAMSERADRARELERVKEAQRLNSDGQTDQNFDLRKPNNMVETDRVSTLREQLAYNTNDLWEQEAYRVGDVYQVLFQNSRDESKSKIGFQYFTEPLDNGEKIAKIEMPDGTKYMRIGDNWGLIDQLGWVRQSDLKVNKTEDGGLEILDLATNETSYLDNQGKVIKN